MFEAARLQPQPLNLSMGCLITQYGVPGLHHKCPNWCPVRLDDKIWFHIMLHHTVSTSNTGKHGIYYLIN